ncbi:MAG: GNAT family N-acetyltransferase [Lachnospiraceae bacterium]|nr:GNAT family N-acetyltransferase [Lachnospiraceae bacterium]
MDKEKFIQKEERPLAVTVCEYTEEKIPDVVDFEKRLREEEDVWGWEIDEAYVRSVKESFRDCRFENAVSLLAYTDGHVTGRIDTALIPTRMDGSVNAYLDWICVLKSARHRGIAQALLGELKAILKEKGVTTLVALTAANEEAQRFYKSVPDSEMRDVGIWINIR